MTSPHSVGSSIKVQGSPLSDALQAFVEQVVVDDDLHNPSMFAITLLDPEHDIVSRTALEPGAEIEITVEVRGSDDAQPLLQGHVVTIECDYDEVGSRVVVRGYDETHRLHAGRNTQVFRNVTDGDIFKQVVQQAGLTVGRVDPVTEVHEHVTQANQTGWDFLISRARSLGRDLVVAGREITLKEPSTADDAPSEAGAGADAESIDPRNLVYGMNLVAFHGRISSAQQVGRIEVRGYDEDRKEAVVGTAQPGTVASALPAGDPMKLGTIFGEPSFVHVTKAKTAREAEDTAKAIAERIGSAAAEVEGTARGHVALRAGVAVRVSRVSEQFNGTYVLSKVRHVLDRHGYRTHFTVSGRHDRSLLGLVSNAVSSNGNGNGGGQIAGAPHRTMNTLVRGIVSEILDPDQLGRVKVKLPWLHDDFSSHWAPVLQLGAGPESGTFFLPAVNDEVLVGFEHGNIDRPFVLGGLFNSIDKPPEYGHFLDDGKVTGKSITSRKGHELAFLDGDDNSGLTIMVVNGSKSPVVSLGFNATDQKLVIQSEGNVDVEAQGEINLSANKITVDAKSKLVLKGGMVEIN
jgi:uncharacterized protein involved in type VI secretion and phage assembly